MISVLGIGGTFQIGFQISSITYMSQVGKDEFNTLVNSGTESTSLLRMLLSGSQRGFNRSLLMIHSHCHDKAEHVEVLKTEE